MSNNSQIIEHNDLPAYGEGAGPGKGGAANKNMDKRGLS